MKLFTRCVFEAVNIAEHKVAKHKMDFLVFKQVENGYWVVSADDDFCNYCFKQKHIFFINRYKHEIK
ncbi:MAG: hypothetical protein GF317_04725 [Candidatus Lokiarchaeota archaeon]|nr:hypothetical protein [Candidatus Lokiarchaeota archaeon]